MADQLQKQGDIVIGAGSGSASAAGAIIFETQGGTERARINADGTGTGWGTVIGGSLSALGWYSVKDTTYGATGNGTTDDTAAIQAAITAATAAGGGVVYLPPGNYKITGLTWASKVSLYGAGPGKSILKPQLGNHAIQVGGGIGTEITDCTFADFEIDGSAQTGLVKGIFITYMLRPRFRNVYIHDTGASGFGCDYLVDAIFMNCTATSCGRNGTTASAGCSGFGIGTGKYDVEDVLLIDCIARTNKRYGVFFERLSSPNFYSKGPQVIGGRFEGNFRGIGDNGSRGLIVQGAHVQANLDNGIYCGADLSTDPGYDGQISDCYVEGNLSNGIYLDYTVGTQWGRYTVKDNHVEGNTGAGIRTTSSGAVPGIRIKDNRVERNNRTGILFSGSSYTTPEIDGNKCNANGQTDVGGVNMGIQWICAMTNPSIRGNVCHDDGGTKKQTYGIRGGVFTITGGVIEDNYLHDNLTGATDWSSTTFTGTVIRNNPGYNPVGPAAITVTASPFTYTGGPTPEVVYIDGGTVSLIVKGGVTLRTATGTSVPLAPNEAVVVTYTVAPTMTKDRQ